MKRRRWLFPLMMSLALLAGCAGGGQGRESGEDLALAIRKEYACMTGCAGRFSLRLDYGQRAFECVVDGTYDQVTGGSLTIVEPELVKGVTARFATGETALVYDGFSLELGPLTDQGISPMESLPTLWRQITGGYIASVAENGKDKTLRVTYRPDGQSPGTGLEAAVVFDTESRKPLSGELFWDGAQVMAAEVLEFEMMGAAQENGTGTNEDVGGN